jgi:hypothetical protein
VYGGNGWSSGTDAAAGVAVETSERTTAAPAASETILRRLMGGLFQSSAGVRRE